ncbi:MAG: DUF4071 domain-containing protein [bacterium]|nr:DUF4071 domain-containing protein [bacterium]
MSSLKKWLEHAPKPPELEEGQQWHVFLSYRSVNRAWVLQLYDVLRSLEYEVFLDQYVLSADQNLIAALEENLEHSASGVLIWSTDAADSDWCKKEYRTFEARESSGDGFRYVVAKLDRADLPVFASQKIWIDFSDLMGGPQGAGLLRLLYGLHGEPLPAAAVRLAAEVDQEARRSEARIKAAVAAGSRDRLLELADSGGLAWETTAALGCGIVEGLVKLGAYEQALKSLEVLKARFPKSLRVQQLKGLALARSGNWQQAQLELEELRELGEQDPETLGILARTWMDSYKKSSDQNHLRRSRDLYAQAFENAPNDYYTGINAAAKSVFLDELDAGNDYAEKVERIVGTEKKDGDYWMTATVAEAQLIKGNYQAAGRLYRDAVSMAAQEMGSHASTWGQARLLLEHLGPSDDEYSLVAQAFGHLGEAGT